MGGLGAPLPAVTLAGVCESLAALFGVFAAYAVIRCFMLLSRGRAWTRQKSVHVIIALLCIARCAFFAAVPNWDGVYFYVRMSSSDVYQTGLYVLEELPTLLLVTLHCQQLLAWADSYLTAVGKQEQYSGVVFRVYILNALLYTAQIVIWVVYDRTQRALDTDYWSLIASILHMTAVLIVAITLVVYGLRMRKAVREVPTNLAMRLRQMRTVNTIVIVCTVAFVVRVTALMAASWATFTDAGGFRDEATPADTAMTALFFVLTELMPLGIILWHNSKMPGKRGRRRVDPGPRKRLSVTGALRSMRFAFSPVAKGTSGGTTPSSARTGAARVLSMGFGSRGSHSDERTPLTAAMVTPSRPGGTGYGLGDGPGSEGRVSDAGYSPVMAVTSPSSTSLDMGYQGDGEEQDGLGPPPAGTRAERYRDAVEDET